MLTNEKIYTNYTDGLSEEDKKEFNILHFELNKIEDKHNVTIVKDKKLKKRVAKLCLKLVNECEGFDDTVRRVSYILSSFIQYHFQDDLDEAISIASELELPKHHVGGDVSEMFNNMEKILKKYIS